MMMTFDLLGALDKVRTFDLAAYHRNKSRLVYVPSAAITVRVTEIRDLAGECNRPEIARLMQRSLDRSRWAAPLIEAAHRVSRKLGAGVSRVAAAGMIGV